jgi:hypothetical protein
MASHHRTPTPADLAAEAGGLGTGFGIILVALFPFAVPCLVLALPLVLPLVPLLLLLPAVWLLRRIAALARKIPQVRITAPRPAGKHHSLRPWLSGK